MPTMIRSLVPPIAGYMSYLLFDTSFSVTKVLALIITVVGVFMGCFVQLYYETVEGSVETTAMGILFLSLSAFTLAT
jgi:drug/metabolite transporter (DMT)-like permease